MLLELAFVAQTQQILCSFTHAGLAPGVGFEPTIRETDGSRISMITSREKCR
jgi:hypothetical protein